MVPLSRVALAIAVAAALTSPAPAEEAAEKKPFGLEAYHEVTWIPEMALSPDGARIAFVRRGRDLPRARQTDDVWIVGTDGRGERRLTWHPDSAESSLAWAPDGSALAFVADRGDGDTIWLLPAAGGEPRPLLSASTGIADLVWSPDGSKIAFTSDVYPECGADDACNAERDGARGAERLTAHVADELFYRHWTHWWDGKVPHVLVVELGGARVRDVTPWRAAAPVFYLWGGVSYDFSADGKELVFQRNPAPSSRAALSTNDDLYAVRVVMDATAPLPAPRNLTPENDAWDGTPKVSPDGRHVAYRRQLVPGYEADEYELAVLERATGAVRVLTQAYDNWVDDHAWLPDGSGLVFLSEEGGRTPLYRVALAGGAPERVVADATIDAFELGPDGKTAYAIRRAVGDPPEIWAYDLAGRAPARAVTSVNRRVAETYDVRPAERMTVEGAGGRPIEVFVVKPHGFDPAKTYPLVLNVHGGPQSQWSDAFRGDWQVYPAAGYVVAFPNPTGSTGYGQAFTAAISRDWGGRVYEDVMKVADALAALPYVDESRMGAMGWSYGGYMMNWLLGQTDRFAAIASMMGIFDLRSFYGATEELWFPEWDLGGTPWTSELYERFNPAAHVENFATPTLVVTGELDYRVPYTQGLQLFTALQRRGVPSRLVVLPDAGHWPGWYEMALYYTAHLDWFERYLGGAPPPWSVEDFAANRVFDEETGERIDRRSVAPEEGGGR